MKILIAEDDYTSRKILTAALKKWGYDPVVTCDGQEAWERLQEPEAAQLAIIDWLMPGMTGLELCKKLRRQNRRDPLYILLLTSKGERQDIVAGLEAGADDYIAKPYDNDELRVRLAVGARLVKSEQKARHYAEKMERLAEERARQLAHSDRLATLGALSAGIAHEINNPVAFISGNVQTQQIMWKKIEPCLVHCLENGVGEAGKLRFILKEMPSIFDGINNGVTRVGAIVKGLKTYSRQGDEEFEDCDVKHCVEEAILITHNALKYRATVINKLSESIPSIPGRPQQITQVLINLLNNAADALETKKQGTICITSRVTPEHVHIMVEDDGLGVREDKLPHIFDPFVTTKPADKGTGLGLSISKGIVEEHGGELIAENRAEGGARFIMTLPIAGKPADKNAA